MRRLVPAIGTRGKVVSSQMAITLLAGSRPTALCPFVIVVADSLHVLGLAAEVTSGNRHCCLDCRERWEFEIAPCLGNIESRFGFLDAPVQVVEGW